MQSLFASALKASVEAGLQASGFFSMYFPRGQHLNTLAIILT